MTEQGKNKIHSADIEPKGRYHYFNSQRRPRPLGSIRCQKALAGRELMLEAK
jgi:hypothetical protein